MNILTPTIQPSDVIQLNPQHRWGPALAVVTEVRKWGVIAAVTSPGAGVAYIRLDWTDFHACHNGAAPYLVDLQ